MTGLFLLFAIPLAFAVAIFVSMVFILLLGKFFDRFFKTRFGRWLNES